MTESSDSIEERIHHQNICDGDGNPNYLLLQTIAALTGVEETELPQLYPCVDDLINQLYQTPPSTEATVELTFTYEGFRITLHQDGHAVLQEM